MHTLLNEIDMWKKFNPKGENIMNVASQTPETGQRQSSVIGELDKIANGIVYYSGMLNELNDRLHPILNVMGLEKSQAEVAEKELPVPLANHISILAKKVEESNAILRSLIDRIEV